jgi:lysozyme
MYLSQDGVLKLVTREGLRLKAYRDTKGILTIGVGHTGPDVTVGLAWTQSQAMAAFKKDVGWAENVVNTVTKPLNQNMFDALVSFTFNVGAAAFAKSTMKKLLDAGDYKGASEEFDKWHKPPEIISRRDGEKAQFLTPV